MYDDVSNSRAYSRADRAPRSRSPWIRAEDAYSPPPEAPVGAVRLDRNEGKPFPSALRALAGSLADGRAPGRYPRVAALEEAIAAREGVDPGRVVVTAGSDDAIARICAATLAPASKLLRFEPDFGMYAIRARCLGAGVVSLPWDDANPFPVERSIDTVDRCASLGLVALASPSNPAGLVVPREALDALLDACDRRGAALLLDGAYREFDGTRETEGAFARALSCRGAFVTGTFSKAYGLAGARVGWAIAPGPREAELLRAAGGPYPVAGSSLAAALAAFEDRPALRDSVALVARERESIEDAMTRAGFGAGTPRSRANFAFRRVADASGFARALLDRGFAIRIFPGRAGLADAVRVSCPQDSGSLERLVAAIAEAGARLAATGRGA